MEYKDNHSKYFLKKCPVCGKKFQPAPEHALKIGGEYSKRLVCSYSCMRKWEKEHEMLRRDEILQQREEKRKGAKSG